jgi:tetratricopeptide (TPR) repeat protein
MVQMSDIYHMKSLLLTLLVSFSVSLCVAQASTAKRLEEAVKIYNRERDSVDTFKPATLGDAQIAYVERTTAKGVAILDSLLRVLPESSEERRVARYFRANFYYQQAFVYGMKGRNEDAYQIMQMIENDFDYFGNSSIFPLRYVFDGKNYSIKYENFQGTYIEFYTGYGEVCANTSRSEKSLSCSRKTVQMTEGNSSYNWYRYIAITKVIGEKKKLNQLDKEMLDMAYKLAFEYSQLDSSYRKTIKENNYLTFITAYNRINDVFAANPSLIGNGELYAKTAAIFQKEGDLNKAEEYYEKAFRYNYPYSKAELEKVVALADRRGNKTLGLNAASAYEKLLSATDCDGWRKVAGYYELFDNNTRRNTALEKAKTCDKLRAEEQRRNDRNNRRRSGGFMIYTATYPLTLITRYNHYRDYGLAVGIGNRRFQIEAGGKLINRNLVLQEDLAFRSIQKEDGNMFWDGYRAHVSLRFISKSQSSDAPFYVGPTFELVNRNFLPVWGNVYDANDLPVVSEFRFSPVEKAYTAYLNYGVYSAKKYLYIDFFTGLGVYYAKFSTGAPQYEGDQYRISHTLLENRKAARFGPAVRMGITMGFSTRR